jgi:hypothetical protein
MKKRNWWTTTTGILSIALGVLRVIAGDADANALAEIVAGVGLVKAKDGKAIEREH